MASVVAVAVGRVRASVGSSGKRVREARRVAYKGTKGQLTRNRAWTAVVSPSTCSIGGAAAPPSRLVGNPPQGGVSQFSGRTASDAMHPCERSDVLQIGLARVFLRAYAYCARCAAHAGACGPQHQRSSNSVHSCLPPAVSPVVIPPFHSQPSIHSTRPLFRACPVLCVQSASGKETPFSSLATVQSSLLREDTEEEGYNSRRPLLDHTADDHTTALHWPLPYVGHGTSHVIIGDIKKVKGSTMPDQDSAARGPAKETSSPPMGRKTTSRKRSKQFGLNKQIILAARRIPWLQIKPGHERQPGGLPFSSTAGSVG